MRSRYITLAMSLILCAALLPATADEGQGTKTHILRDEFGFEQPIDAMTITLPDGWDVKGAVQWHGRPSCVIEQMKLHFMATAPDGKQWVELIPGGAWGWSSTFNMMPHLAQQGFAGCDARPILDIRSFVEHYIPTIRPGAKISSMRPRPDQAQEAAQREELITARAQRDASCDQLLQLICPDPASRPDPRMSPEVTA